MEKEFIPYEQALALKELGYDEPCFGTYRKGACNENPFEYNIDFHTKVQLDHNLCPKNSEYVNDWISAPTFSQAFRWFRKKYGAEFYITDRRHTSVKYYEVSLFDGDRTDMVFGKSLTYEEAESECLKKLIKIINHG